MAFINKSLIPLYNYSRFCRHLVQQGKLDYSLSELMKYDFFKITIPILQKELSLSEKCIERIIAYSYVLTNDMLYDLNWLDNKCAFCDFFYIDGISWSDFQISALKDFVVLYNSWTHRYETKEYNFETSLFEHVGKLDISYELPCDIDGEFYFTLFELGMNTENKLTYDLISKTTNIGLHRDDFEIYINDKSIQTFGSEGQMRNTILAIKLAIMEIYKKENAPHFIKVVHFCLMGIGR